MIDLFPNFYAYFFGGISKKKLNKPGSFPPQLNANCIDAASPLIKSPDNLENLKLIYSPFFGMDVPSVRLF